MQKCKTCYIQQRKNTKTSSIHGRLRETLNNAKESSRTKRREINISLKNLVALWEKQKGRCFYSGIQMTFDGVDKYRTVSLDRIDSSKGYVGDNIVLCCAIVNVMKNNLPVESFVALCENIVYWQKHRTGF